MVPYCKILLTKIGLGYLVWVIFTPKTPKLVKNQFLLSFVPFKAFYFVVLLNKIVKRTTYYNLMRKMFDSVMEYGSFWPQKHKN